MNLDTDNYRDLLSIADTHELKLADSRFRHARSEARESHLLRETDSQHKLVAHYRIWHHQSAIAPFREQRGWEKYGPDGTLLDREVRYSEQPAGTQVH